MAIRVICVIFSPRINQSYTDSSQIPAYKLSDRSPQFLPVYDNSSSMS